jgi:hypothetical protein
MSHQIHSYTELRKQIHDDLRLQHPEWVQPNGESPICDSYEARLEELLGALTRRDEKKEKLGRESFSRKAGRAASASSNACRFREDSEYHAETTFTSCEISMLECLRKLHEEKSDS